MHKVLFILLRAGVAIASLAALAGTVLALLVTGAFALLKGSGHIVMAMARLIVSGFRDAGPTLPSERVISLPLAGLAIVFMTMFTSVFTPGERIFLHILAGMTAVATVWTVWTMSADTANNMPYLSFMVPVMVLWFVYYGVCLWRLGRRA
jgi:hypothetical protein